MRATALFFAAALLVGTSACNPPAEEPSEPETNEPAVDETADEVVPEIEGEADHADHADHAEPGQGEPEPGYAVAVLRATDGNEVTGTIHFSGTDGNITVSGDVAGLTPGAHGFHVHMWGDCSAADGTSTGGHFNPGGHDHGAPDAEMRHVGDLGNIIADEAGNATVTHTDSHLAFSGVNSIVGRGLIIHAGEDDLQTQPTGAAGGRIACAVIGVAAPPAPAE